VALEFCPSVCTLLNWRELGEGVRPNDLAVWGWVSSGFGRGKLSHPLGSIAHPGFIVKRSRITHSPRIWERRRLDQESGKAEPAAP